MNEDNQPWRYITVNNLKVMKNVTSYIMAVVLLMVAGSCAVTDVDRSANFKSYRTFAWGESEVKVENPVYDSDLITKRIRNTVEKEFSKRGIRMDKKDPDFLVSYRTFTQQKQEVSGGSYYGYGYPFFPMRFYPYGFGWGFPYGAWGNPPRERYYTEGTLIIDITDKKTDELVWRGTVKGNVDDIADLQKQIAKGVKAIMKKYPVTPDEPLPLISDEKVIG
jgi:hypothetical protein